MTIRTAEFQLAENVIHSRSIPAVAFGDLFFDEIVRCHGQDEFAIESKAKVLQSLRIHRIDQGDMKSFVREVHRKGSVQTRGAGWHEGEKFGRWSPSAEVDKWCAELRRDHWPNVCFALDHLEVGEDLGDIFAAVLHLVENILTERTVDHPATYEKVYELVAVHVIGSWAKVF